MTWKTEQEQHFLISNLTPNQFLFRHKSHRCNIQPIVEYLVTQVKAINSDYWNKQCAILKYFKSTQNDALVLKADGASRMIEHVHASCFCCTWRIVEPHWRQDKVQLKQYQANWEKAQAQGKEFYRWGIGNMYHTMILISRLSRQYIFGNTE